MIRRQNKGFTIVELIIVVVIIGILTALVVVGYNGIQKRAAVNLVKDTLQSAATVMKTAEVETGSYPTLFPSTLKVGENMGLALANGSATFCINGTYSKYNDIAWHVEGGGAIEEGLCTGSVIVASIIGDYNTSAGGVTTPVSSAGLAIGDGGGFKVSTNEAWTSLKIEWDAVPGATRYEFQWRSGSAATWYYTTTANGQGGIATTNSSSTYSGYLPSGTTSYNWSAPSIKPGASTDIYEYRVRSYNGSTAGSWFTALLSTPLNSNMPTPSTLNVSSNNPTNWTGFNVSWSSDMTRVPSYYWEFQWRAGSTDPWYNTRLSDGTGGYTISGSAYSSNIPTATTSYTWPNSTIIPTSTTQTYEYRLRAVSGTISGIYSPWKTATLATPTSANMPTLSTLTVSTTTNDWTGINVSWSGDVSAVPSYYYEFQYKPTGATWYYTRISDGQGGYSNAGSAYTSNVPGGTNAYSWSTSTIRPTASGQTYEYRIRPVSATISGLVGEWKTATLTPPDNSTFTGPSSLSATSPGWTGLNVSWNGATNVPSAYYEFQYRSTPTGTWYYTRISDGTGGYSNAGSAYTSNVPSGTTSYNWTGSTIRPSAAGQTYEYRVRAVSNTINGGYGPWVTTSLSR